MFVCNVCLCMLYIYTSLSPQGARLEESTIKYFLAGCGGETVFCLFVLNENVENFNYEEMQRSEKVFLMLL